MHHALTTINEATCCDGVHMMSLMFSIDTMLDREKEIPWYRNHTAICTITARK